MGYSQRSACTYVINFIAYCFMFYLRQCVRRSAEQTNDSSEFCACEVVMCCLVGLSYTDWWYGIVVELCSPGGNRIISDKIPFWCHLSTTHLVNEPEGPCSKDISSTNRNMTHYTVSCIKDTNTHTHTHRRNKVSNQRNEMIKQIKSTCVTWPSTNETPVNDYLQLLVNFIKFIDFTDLQWHVNIKIQGYSNWLSGI
jgi:hypothetical protein